jgi:SAM-dependent methyltransferase
MVGDEDCCFYCGGRDLYLAYGQKFHQRKKDHGPFDLYVCTGCGSALTLPLPSTAVLAELYRSFEFGLSESTRRLLSDDPTAAWHQTCVKRLIRLSGRTRDAVFTWVDVGAGGGEIARLFGEYFPASRGVALDIHERPPGLADGPTNVEWRRVDIAHDSFAADLGVKSDVAFAIGVWEHVRRPDIFARNMLSLLNPNGILYMETANYGSFARRLLGQFWPYFLPGEHLCMPTLKGARLCLERELENLQDPCRSVVIEAHPILIRYSVRFALAKLSMFGLAKVVPSTLYAYVPSGALEAVVRRGADLS